MKQEPKALTENNLSPSAPVPPDRQKAISLTAGTLAFFAACLFLIAGLCRFSFYVLKNHRNAVDKDAFVKTYVDVQPYNGFKNADYIALDSFKNGAPAVFFDKTHPSAKNTKPAKKQNSVPPLPVYASATAKPAEHEPPLRAVPARRLAPAVKAPISVAAVSVKKEKIPDNAVSLDELIISGTKILDDGDEKIADAAEIEDAFAFDIAKAELFEPKEEKKHVPDLPADVADPDKPPFTPAIRKKSPAKTVWIDVAALRRSLKEQENSALKILAAADKKEAIKKENDALLKMGGAKQIASLKNETASDTELNVSKDATKTEKSKTSVAETRLPLKAVGKKEDENVKKAVRSKVAQAQKKANDSFVQTENLWKIAVANGTPKNKLAVKKPEPENEKIIAIKIWLEKKPTIIPRRKNTSKSKTPRLLQKPSFTGTDGRTKSLTKPTKPNPKTRKRRIVKTILRLTGWIANRLPYGPAWLNRTHRRYGLFRPTTRRTIPKRQKLSRLRTFLNPLPKKRRKMKKTTF